MQTLFLGPVIVGLLKKLIARSDSCPGGPPARQGFIDFHCFKKFKLLLVCVICPRFPTSQEWPWRNFLNKWYSSLYIRMCWKFDPLFFTLYSSNFVFIHIPESESSFRAVTTPARMTCKQVYPFLLGFFLVPRMDLQIGSQLG